MTASNKCTDVSYTAHHLCMEEQLLKSNLESRPTTDILKTTVCLGWRLRFTQSVQKGDVREIRIRKMARVARKSRGDAKEIGVQYIFLKGG